MRRLLLSKVPQYLADRATKRLGKSCCSDWPTASDRYIHVHVTRGTLKGVGLEACACMQPLFARDVLQIISDMTVGYVENLLLSSKRTVFS